MEICKEIKNSLTLTLSTIGILNKVFWCFFLSYYLPTYFARGRNKNKVGNKLQFKILVSKYKKRVKIKERKNNIVLWKSRRKKKWTKFISFFLSHSYSLTPFFLYIKRNPCVSACLMGSNHEIYFIFIPLVLFSSVCLIPLYCFPTFSSQNIFKYFIKFSSFFLYIVLSFFCVFSLWEIKVMWNMLWISKNNIQRFFSFFFVVFSAKQKPFYFYWIHEVFCLRKIRKYTQDLNEIFHLKTFVRCWNEYCVWDFW